MCLYIYNKNSGKTVQIIPHVTDEIIRRIQVLSQIPVSNDDSDEQPDVCVIELGGTIGDLESGRWGVCR